MVKEILISLARPSKATTSQASLGFAGNGDANVWLKMDKNQCEIQSKMIKVKNDQRWWQIWRNRIYLTTSYYIHFKLFPEPPETPSSGSRINITIPAVLSSSSSPSATIPKKLKASSICGRRQQLKISSGTSKRAAKSKTSGSPRRWNNSRKFQLPM